MTDFLEVKAKRTFAVGKELKTKRSDPFKIEAGEARQLEASGLVDIVGVVETVEEADAPAKTPVITSERQPEPAPKKKAKADAVDENS